MPGRDRPPNTSEESKCKMIKYHVYSIIVKYHAYSIIIKYHAYSISIKIMFIEKLSNRPIMLIA